MICRLCLQNKNLRNSHIIPEFLYKPLYDEKHTLQKTSTKRGEATKKLQKGPREDLFCDDCEQNMSKWEDYAARFWNLKAPKPEKYNNAVVFRRLNYQFFKLFQMSLIWRCSISELEEFQNIKLGIPKEQNPFNFTKHEERIREMLLANNPGEPHDYGCLIIFSSKHVKYLKDGIIIGDCLRVESHRRYLLYIQGTFWMWIVSSHSERFPFKGNFLQKDGTLPFLKEDKVLDNWMQKFMSDVQKAERKTENDCGSKPPHYPYYSTPSGSQNYLTFYPSFPGVLNPRLFKLDPLYVEI